MAKPTKTTAGSTPRQSHARRFVDAIETVIGREMRPRTDDVLLTRSISPPEMRSLMFLGRNGMTVMSDYAQGIGVPLSTATRIINRLVRKGLAVRRRSDLDRRIVEVDLSPTAYEHRSRFLAKRLHASQLLLAPLTSKESETLLALIEKALQLSAMSAENPPEKS